MNFPMTMILSKVRSAFNYSSTQAWESMNQTQWTGINVYQSGGYWTIGTPHLVDAIIKTKGKKHAKSIIVDMISHTLDGVM